MFDVILAIMAAFAMIGMVWFILTIVNGPTEKEFQKALKRYEEEDREYYGTSQYEAES